MNKVLTALITPFNAQKQIDYVSLALIIKQQLAQGVDGFVVCGTTAEAPTLSAKERLRLLKFVIAMCNYRVEIWYGCGSNNTMEVMHRIIQANNLPISGYLIVTPYYNRPSQQGLYEHFVCCSKVSAHPIMVYIVPKRCGVILQYQTMVRLIENCHNIVAIKYAYNEFDYIKKIKAIKPTFLIYNGVDELWKQGEAIGMSGLISVISHVCLPLLKMDEQEEVINEIAKLCCIETNPVPIKYMLSLMHQCEEYVRLPLCSLQQQHKEEIQRFIKKLNKL